MRNDIINRLNPLATVCKCAVLHHYHYKSRFPDFLFRFRSRIDFLAPFPDNSFKVVANIPYNVTMDIFGRLLDVPHTPFKEGVMITEWGAAKRFTETEQTTDPRIIGWNTWFKINIVNRVSPQSFSPAPSVQSAMVKIDRRQEPMVNSREYYRYMAFVSSLLEYPRIMTFRFLNYFCFTPLFRKHSQQS